MIYKDLDPFTGSDKFAVAGRRAEEQMVHYLKRFFGSSQEVDVLNYLRIELAGEVAQMDHLVLHPYGLTIVESKSVAGSVQIQDDGQWTRWFNKQPQGMRSPVTQAEMQGMLLRELLSRTVKQKGFFDTVDMDVLVAISDTGRIQWPSSGPLQEVCKADQVPGRIESKMQQRQGSGPAVLSSDHRRAIAQFLLSVHKPLQEPRPETAAAASVEKVQAPAITTEAPPETESAPRGSLPAKSCKHCGATDLEMQYGKYGYYFVCKACEKNTGIKFACPSCGAEGRIRKQGAAFFAECKSCSASSLFHTNA